LLCIRFYNSFFRRGNRFTLLDLRLLIIFTRLIRLQRLHILSLFWFSLLSLRFLYKSFGGELLFPQTLTAGEWEFGDVLYLRDINPHLFETLGMEPVVTVVAPDHVRRLCLSANAVNR